MSNPRIGYDDTQVAILEELKAHRSEYQRFSISIADRLARVETSLMGNTVMTERVRVLELFKYQLLGISIGSSIVISVVATIISWLVRGIHS